MKTEMNEPVTLLYHRVDESLHEILCNHFEENQTNWCDDEKWYYFLKSNIDDFLNKEEKEAVIKAQIKRLENEDMNSIILNLSIYGVVVRIIEDLKQVIKMTDTIQMKNNDDFNTNSNE